LDTTIEDVLHIHGGRGGDEVTDQLDPLCLPSVAREPRVHPMEVLAGVELHGGEGNAGSLPASCHHIPLMVLHQEKLLEASFLRLMERGRQLLL
jgi:hypothetical protein